MSWDRTHGIKESLAGIADARFQEAAWTSTAGPIVSSLQEDISQLFDDTGLGSDLDKGALVFTAEIDDQLRALDRALAKLSEIAGPVEDILASEEMARTRSLAATTLFAIVRHDAATHRSSLAE